MSTKMLHFLTKTATTKSDLKGNVELGSFSQANKALSCFIHEKLKPLYFPAFQIGFALVNVSKIRTKGSKNAVRETSLV